ncbi:hypothetical protein HYO65_gp080 [Tenacibaculum phage PTm1]|uniref:Uncharacterized protein n=1 Tax=Tenacibaculum phage PTm1 TaxID=2547425 RepID=A0A5S9BZ04_9CAUD|nr:hypothetical protein HYO65_gp080 [Tenacibaculum phage PTm1]BBI90472.1 hypothetical protein [Tenacibaculum phage PTm1]
MEKIGRGKYKVIKKPSYDLTTTQLRKEAYPNYIPWKVLSEMEDLFTDFSIDYTQDVILLNDSHLSVIMNPKTKHKRFLGYSIRSVAESYARNKNKTIKFAQ